MTMMGDLSTEEVRTFVESLCYEMSQLDGVLDSARAPHHQKDIKVLVSHGDNIGVFDDLDDAHESIRMQISSREGRVCDRIGASLEGSLLAFPLPDDHRDFEDGTGEVTFRSRPYNIRM